MTHKTFLEFLDIVDFSVKSFTSDISQKKLTRSVLSMYTILFAALWSTKNICIHMYVCRCEKTEQWRDFCEKKERSCGVSTDRRTIDREISTDYNGKLSASRDAFFSAIDFAHRRTEDREYESNDGVRGEKCSGSSEALRAYRETRGKSRKRGRWMVSFVQGQCSLFE
jgi:hypothetical protein